MIRSVLARVTAAIGLALVGAAATAGLPAEKVPDFQVRLKLTALEGTPPAAPGYTLSGGEKPVQVLEGQWSDWVRFGREQVKAALGGYPNSYSGSWPMIFHVSISPVKGVVKVELEGQAEGSTDTGTAELAGGTLGLAVWRDEDKGTAHVTNFGTYNRLKYWSLIDKLDVKGRLPEKILLQDRFIGPGDNDRVALREGVAGMRKLGFNVLLTDGDKALGEVGRRVGFRMFKGAIYNPPGYAFDFGGDESSELALRNWARSVMANFTRGGYRASEVAMYTTSDEPGFYYPTMYRTVNENPAYLERFHEFLREQNLKPADFGLKDWSEVKMIGRSKSRGTLPERRLYYWSQRFIPRQSAEHFARTTRALEEAFYPGLPIVVNWNFFAARAYFPGPFANNADKTSPDAAMGGHDWFDFGRLRGSNSLWTEDWFGDEWAYQWSFYSDKLRSASCTGEFGALVIPRVAGAMPDGIMYKIMSLIGHGSKHLSFFVFGPEYSFPGNCYSQNPRVFNGLARTMRLIGEAEELLYPGRPVKPQVALLHHRSAEMWDQTEMEIADGIADATNVNLNGACSEYTAELYDLYLALMHEQVPVEFISEDDATWGALDPFKVIYVIEPNVPVEAQKRLVDWVKAGGVLVTTSQAACFDQYNEPCHVLDEVRGVVEAPRPRLVIANLGAVEKVGTVGSGLATRIGFDAYGVRGTIEVKLEPADGREGTKTLATFDDRTPAITMNRYGEGTAVHFGVLPGLSYRKSAKEGRGKFAESFDVAARAWINWPLELAKVTKPVEVSQPMVEAPILVSEKGLAITLLNWTNEPVKALTLKVPVDRRIESVRSVKQGRLSFRDRQGVLEIALPLDTVDVVLVEFRELAR